MRSFWLFTKMTHKAFLTLALLLTLSLNVEASDSTIVRPFERQSLQRQNNRIDTYVFTALRKKGIEPANICSEEVFVRRVYLDIIGTLPTPQEVSSYYQNKSPKRRSELIDALLKREEFIDYCTLKWCDCLRVKSEFPINLWPNAVQAYHRWIHDSLKDNMPYDQFARELLTSSGSNFRVPPVNFYRAIQGRDPAAIAKAAALTFMGVRIETWPEERRKNMEAFFSRVAYKGTQEWKEEIVYLDPKPAAAFKAVFPDGKTVIIQPDQDPRSVFADWLIDPNNPWFARNIVNRIWAQLIGRGIINEPDDIRDDNPPSNPELLDWLARQLAISKYDLRYIYKIILNSRTYQQSSIPQNDSPQAQALFAYYPVRRLDAEVLIDALDWICESGESYSSIIPEPYTYIPENKRTIELADGSITSQFLQMFGRPARDTGLISERNNQPSDFQSLYLLNSTDMKTKLERSPRIARIMETFRGRRGELISNVYLTVLSRYPTPEELAKSEKYFQTPGITPKQAVDDTAWALINSKEFLYRH
jgi:hypothetical protein